MALTHGTRRALLLAGFLLVSLYRVHLCRLPPAETTDVLRNVGYGRVFWQQGFRVYGLTPPQVAEGREWERLWPTQVFNYPVMTLYLFAVLAKVSTSLVLAKLVLSAFELASAALVRRITGSWPLALAYYASPASLWWVSREGQFESFLVLLTLLAIERLERGHDVAAFACLGLAIQVKLFPVLLLPAFLLRSRRRGPALLALLLSSVPSLGALALSTYLTPMLRPGYWWARYNPFAWSPFDEDAFDWIPNRIVAWNTVLTLALLVALVAELAARLRPRPERAVRVAGPLAFLVLLKTASWAQFWYFLAMPALLLDLEPSRRRNALFLLALLEGRATMALHFGPVGMPQWFPIEKFLHGGA